MRSRIGSPFTFGPGRRSGLAERKVGEFMRRDMAFVCGYDTTPQRNLVGVRHAEHGGRNVRCVRSHGYVRHVDTRRVAHAKAKLVDRLLRIEEPLNCAVAGLTLQEQQTIRGGSDAAASPGRDLCSGTPLRSATRLRSARQHGARLRAAPGQHVLVLCGYR
ncbi:MAG: hypothetical protein ACKO91_10235 [Acidimicrobiales bacterium]